MSDYPEHEKLKALTDQNAGERDTPQWRCINCKQVVIGHLKPDNCPSCKWCAGFAEVAPEPSGERAGMLRAAEDASAEAFAERFHVGDGLIAGEFCDLVYAFDEALGRDGTGCLIEEHFGPAIHWIALTDEPWPKHEVISHNDEFDMTVNNSPVRRVKVASEALRFARKEDAEAFIKLISRFMFKAVATEHQWISAKSIRTSANNLPEGGKVDFDAAELGVRVRAKLDAGNLSFRTAAKRIGISAATLNRVARGNDPDVHSYLKIAAWCRSPLPDTARIEALERELSEARAERDQQAKFKWEAFDANKALQAEVARLRSGLENILRTDVLSKAHAIAGVTAHPAKESSDG